MNERLSKSDWITHGLGTLAENGPGALKVGVMAEKLNVSRGSFYWHFRDIADFRAHLLEVWRERTTDQVISKMEAEEAEPDRLKWLMKRAFGHAPRLDRAIRAWAADDEKIASMVAAADAARIAYIADLLTGAGVEPQQAKHRATFLYWAYLGQPLVMDMGHSAMTIAAMDEISALFER